MSQLGGKMINIPIKHHYIPQFILKNFCFDESNHIHFFFFYTHAITIKATREVFMKPFLYQDNINHPDKEMQIEIDFAKYENEVSQFFKRFSTKKEICLTNSENELLKLFVAIMRLRSDMSSNFFKQELSEESKEFYSKYQPDGNFDDFWKRNLGNILSCRSWREVNEHENIDLPFKAFMKRDAYGIADMYFIVAERRGGTDFVLSDSYPTVIYEQLTKDDKSIEIPMFDFLPLSPERMLLFVSTSVRFSNESVTHFSNEFLKPPRKNHDNNQITIKVKKVYENDVEYINQELIKNNKEGFIFKDKERLGNLLISDE